jgi:hypothetical protein
LVLKAVKPGVAAAQPAVAKTNPLDNLAATFFLGQGGDAGYFGGVHGLILPATRGAKSELLFNFELPNSEKCPRHPRDCTVE